MVQSCFKCYVLLLSYLSFLGINKNVVVVVVVFIRYKQGAVAPKRTWGPLIFIFKFKFLQYNQSIGKV